MGIARAFGQQGATVYLTGRTLQEGEAPLPGSIAGAAEAVNEAGGVGIAVACDLRLASRDMKLGIPIARTLGNCLSASNLARLAALIGEGRVKDLIFTGRLIGAEEALAAGLVSEILEDRAALLERAQALAAELSERAPLTLRATKEALRRLRAAARTVLAAEGREGWDYVLIGRRDATAERPFDALLADLRKALSKIHGPS